MAVKLRLMRMGRKGQPYYRIVAVDSRKKRDGAYLEKIGHYSPLTRPAEVIVDDDKAIKWLKVGAIPSETVRNIFSRCGVMMAFDLHKRGLKPEEINEKVARFRLEKEAKLREKASAEKKAVEKTVLAETAEEEVTEKAVEEKTAVTEASEEEVKGKAVEVKTVTAEAVEEEVTKKAVEVKTTVTEAAEPSAAEEAKPESGGEKTPESSSESN